MCNLTIIDMIILFIILSFVYYVWSNNVNGRIIMI